jgi:hypothetical protein
MSQFRIVRDIRRVDQAQERRQENELFVTGAFSLLEPITRFEHPLTIGCIGYTLAEGRPGEEVCYWGDMTLGPGDCVVQRATNHAWRNRSGKPVRMAVVMLGLARDC